MDRHRQYGLARFFRSEHVVMSIIAVPLGAASAIAVIAFRAAIGGGHLVGFGFSHEYFIRGVANAPWWQIVLVPTIGGLAVGLFLHWTIGGGRAHGVADVIEGSTRPGETLSMRDGIASAVAAAASIGVGASTGREGPVVHLSATIGAALARRLHLPRSSARTMMGCGAAAAVAASFNAPIAGVFFALEVIMRHHSLRAIAPIVISSVAATIISRARYGNAPAFNLPETFALSMWEFPAFALLGIVAAISAIVFIRAIFLAENIAVRSRAPVWLRPAVAGLAIGGLAVFTPQILGVGYEATDATLRVDFAFSFLLVLIAAKFVATAISLGFGFGGGVFSPAILLGAMIGGAFGMVAGAIFPQLYSGTAAYAVIGMGALAGAVLGSPMSTILIVFELTADYTLTIAVMIATVVASLLTQQLYSRSFFHAQLARRGLHYADALDDGLLRGLRVADVMEPDCCIIGSNSDVALVRERLYRSAHGDVIVTDANGGFVGTITCAAFTSGDAVAANKCASDLIGTPIRAVTVADDLQSALTSLQAQKVDHLPVVRRRDAQEVVGVVRENSILRALLRARSEDAGEA